jgi:hypothetical protein
VLRKRQDGSLLRGGRIVALERGQVPRQALVGQQLLDERQDDLGRPAGLRGARLRLAALDDELAQVVRGAALGDLDVDDEVLAIAQASTRRVGHGRLADATGTRDHGVKAVAHASTYIGDVAFAPDDERGLDGSACREHAADQLVRHSLRIPYGNGKDTVR